MRLALLALLAVSSPLAAQTAADWSTQRPDPLRPQGENMATPPSWTVRFDAPHGAHEQHREPTVGADSTADVWFVNMTPGWHLTTGPGGIFYHPASTAEGAYRAESKIHFFDPKGRNEAYGLFFGGADLDADAQRYDYFLIRNSGEFLVKRRTGDATETLVPWTASDAILTYGPDTEGNVTNTLAVVAEADEVAFVINGTEAARLPREDVQTDGVLGLRVNHEVNLHIETLVVVPGSVE